MSRRRNKGEERDTGAARITRLLARARVETTAGRAELAHRYGDLALRIAQKYQTGLDADAKAQVCRKCGAFRTRESSRTRLRAGRVVTTCLKCGAVARKPLVPRPPTAGRQVPGEAGPVRSPSSRGRTSEAR